MTVTIDSYGYMVCSDHPKDETGMCSHIRSFMFSPESAQEVQKSAILHIPVHYCIFAQVRFKQWHSEKNRFIDGHEGAGTVQIWLEWKPDGSSRHYDEYLGTYLRTDTIRDVYMQIKFYLFDKYAPYGDGLVFDPEFKCLAREHNAYAESIFRSDMSEGDKVAHLFTIHTERKCMVCWRKAQADQVDLSAYVPDADGRLDLPRSAPRNGQPPADQASVARPNQARTQYSQGGVIPPAGTAVHQGLEQYHTDKANEALARAQADALRARTQRVLRDMERGRY